MPVRKQGERRAEPGTVPAADKGTAAPRGAVPSAGVVAVTHLCRAQTVSCPPADTQRALRLLQEYRSKLSQAEDRQLRNSIERVIGIFQSNLFQALIGKRCPSSRAGFLRVAACGVGEGKRFAVLSEPSCSSVLCVCVCVCGTLTHVLFQSASFCHLLCMSFLPGPRSLEATGAAVPPFWAVPC